LWSPLSAHSTVRETFESTKHLQINSANGKTQLSREKCIAANPEIVASKFGWHVHANTEGELKNGLDGESIILRMKDYTLHNARVEAQANGIILLATLGVGLIACRNSQPGDLCPYVLRSMLQDEFKDFGISVAKVAVL
jgi:hypothetical protein